jgi:hypothetical protein
MLSRRSQRHVRAPQDSVDELRRDLPVRTGVHSRAPSTPIDNYGHTFGDD